MSGNAESLCHSQGTHLHCQRDTNTTGLFPHSQIHNHIPTGTFTGLRLYLSWAAWILMSRLCWDWKQDRRKDCSAGGVGRGFLADKPEGRWTPVGSKNRPTLDWRSSKRMCGMEVADSVPEPTSFCCLIPVSLQTLKCWSGSERDGLEKKKVTNEGIILISCTRHLK